MKGSNVLFYSGMGASIILGMLMLYREFEHSCSTFLQTTPSECVPSDIEALLVIFAFSIFLVAGILRLIELWGEKRK